MGMNSLPGSELSCHLSHGSSAGASVPDLTAAPPPPPAPHSSPPPPTSSSLHPHKPSNDFNVNRDRPTEKHYAMHLPHEEKPDNCLMVNIRSEVTTTTTTTTSTTATHLQVGQSPGPSSGSGHSPIDYFQKGQPLPPAFRLQQAYDSQTEQERRRISRLSQCHDTKELARCSAREERAENSAGTNYGEVLPQSDPAKLAALEQFDRDNLSSEKDCNSFRSDPKKLAALKQFDDQLHVVQQEEAAHSRRQQQQHRQGLAPLQENNLASDPAKLAQLRLFDESNLKRSEDHQSGREDEAGEALLASDPRKLAALTRFDAENCAPQNVHTDTPTATDSDPRKLAALTRFDAANCANPASQMSGQSSQMSGQSAHMYGQSSQMSGQSAHMSAHMSGQSLQMSGQSAHMYSQSSQMSGQPTTTTTNSLKAAVAVETSRRGGEHCPAKDSTSFPISKLDYIVMTSQREALEACCASLGHHQSQSRLSTTPPATNPATTTTIASVTESCQTRLQSGHATAIAGEMKVPPADAVASSSNDESLLLRRREDLFDMYSKALEEMDDDNGEEEEENFGNENADCENAYTEENENDRYVANVGPVGSNLGEGYSPYVQGQVAVDHRDGHYHHHPVPTEQDESSVLNYFKQRQQHYEKTFSKAQLSQC